ncbi:MAG: oligosaccharide flippase family protein [Candidatus Omnitrophota bacterium]|jgi:O-antigen/teichoic acid export membrane protein
MKRTKEIFFQVGVYTGSTFLTQLITLFTAVISRRILGPVQTGIWTTLQVIVDYSKYSTLGIMSAVNRDIPYYLGKKDERQAHELKNLAFSFILASSSLIALGIVAFAVLARHWFRQEIVWGLFLIAAIVILQRINNILISLLRSFKKFHVEASQMIFSAIVNAILVVLLSYRFQIYGFIFAMALSFLFNIVYLFMKYPFDFHWILDFKKLRPLFVFGFPLMSLGLLMAVVKSLDRIMLAKYLGFQAVGLYSIALMACSFISNFSISFATILFPHAQEKFALAENPQGMAEYIKKSSAGYALILPLLIAAAAFLTPFVVIGFLPQFISSILTLRILVLSSFFIALLQPYNDFLITIRRHLVLFPFWGVSILISWQCYYWVARLGGGISGFAIATTAIFFLMFTGLFFIAGHYLRDPKAVWEGYWKLMTCFAFLSFFVLILIKYFSSTEITLAGLLCQGGIYMIFCCPIVFILNRKFHILEILREKLKQGDRKHA